MTSFRGKGGNKGSAAGSPATAVIPSQKPEDGGTSPLTCPSYPKMSANCRAMTTLLSQSHPMTKVKELGA